MQKAEIHFKNCDVWERIRAKRGSEDDMCLAALFLLLKDLEVYRNKGEVVQAQLKGLFCSNCSFYEIEGRGCVCDLGTGTGMNNKFPITNSFYMSILLF